jgi:hypothetical protein
LVNHLIEDEETGKMKNIDISLLKLNIPDMLIVKEEVLWMHSDKKGRVLYEKDPSPFDLLRSI